MNDEKTGQKFEDAQKRIDEAVRETQEQAKVAANQLGKLLWKGAQTLKKAADAASDSIREDINKRP